MCNFPVKNNQVLDINMLKKQKSGQLVYTKGKVIESDYHLNYNKYQTLSLKGGNILLRHPPSSTTPDLNEKIVVCGVISNEEGSSNIDVLSYYTFEFAPENDTSKQ
jgi:hypothetical protein